MEALLFGFNLSSTYRLRTDALVQISQALASTVLCENVNFFIERLHNLEDTQHLLFW